jgi:hypothetical protein
VENSDGCSHWSAGVELAQVSITLDVDSHITATMQHRAVNALNDLLAVKLAVNQDGNTQNPSSGA